MELTIPLFRRTCIPVSTLSRALIVPKSRMSWKVRPSPIRALLCGPSRVTSCPIKTKVPVVGRIRPLTMLKKVVLPAPFGPMRLTMDLSGMSKSTALTATRPPKVLVIPRASSMFVAASASGDTSRLRHLVVFTLTQLLLALAVRDYSFRSQEHHRHQQDAEEEEIVLGKIRVREQGASQGVADCVHPLVDLR